MKLFLPVFAAIVGATVVIALVAAEGVRAKYLYRIIDLVIGGLFIYAGIVKALDPVGFANDIDNYRAVPWVIGVRLAFFLPWLEILCGLALITRRLYLGSLTIITGLMMFFILISIVAKARGLDITCGCFGHVSKSLTFTWHLLLDFAILGALCALWWPARARFAVGDSKN